MTWLRMRPRSLPCALAPRLTATSPKKAPQNTISVHRGLYAYSRSIPPNTRFLCCFTMVSPVFFHPPCLWQPILMHSIPTAPLAVLLLQRCQGIQQSGLQVERSLDGFPAVHSRG